MNKIEFTPYYPKCYYPKTLGKLPKCLRDFECVMTENNNMNLLAEAMHAHEVLKKNVLMALVERKRRAEDRELSHLVTLS
jgi:hypothetical protein